MGVKINLDKTVFFSYICIKYKLMRIKENTIKNLDKKGIYSIISPSNKRYIGSTKKSFIGRLNNHLDKLRSGNHSNQHLQNSYNKYGKDSFEFEILEVLSEDIEKQEKYWISYFNSSEKEFGYNIIKDPSIAPSLQQNIKSKISNTLQEKYKSGEIKLNSGIFKKGSIPWNKNKKYSSTDHLKVPKKTTNRKSYKETLRRKSPIIEVWKDNSLIFICNSSIDLQEMSLKEDFILKEFLNLRNPNGRNGYPPYFLSSFNINKSCKTGKKYKGLNFKVQISAPLYREV